MKVLGTLAEQYQRKLIYFYGNGNTELLDYVPTYATVRVETFSNFVMHIFLNHF